MDLAFAGTPAFALAALSALHEAGHAVRLVLTQPDRPAGRGLRLQPSPVKEFALAHGLALAQPRSLRLDGRFAEEADEAREALRRAAPELMVVAAYGLILPEWALALPPRGCINIHASLLPRWRGAAPIQRAIEAGDSESGVTLMRMERGLDTGPMLLSRAEPIGAGDTAATLQARLAALGAALIVQCLQDPEAWTESPQPSEGVTYAAKIDKAEAAIDWTQPAVAIERRLRAFDPSPGCTAVIGGQALKLWRARVLPEGSAPGGATPPGSRVELGAARLAIACGAGAVEILQLQPPGGRRMAARDWLAGGGAAVSR